MNEVILFLSDACYVRRATLALRSLDRNVSVFIEEVGHEIELTATFSEAVRYEDVQRVLGGMTGLVEIHVPGCVASTA